MSHPLPPLRSTSVAAASLALLALYGAELIFALQNVADRFTVLIFPRLIRRVSLLSVSIQAVTSATACLLILAAPVWPKPLKPERA